MSPHEVAAVVRVRLAVQLDEDLRALDRLATAVKRLLASTGDVQGEWVRVRALSFEIERWYTALESTLERVLRSLDGSCPEGRSWHEDLLRASCLAIDGFRPALVSKEAADAMREVMRFRHFARHGYDREPEVERVDELGRVTLAAHEACADSFRQLRSWLLDENRA
jgi:hypothetical protein